MTSAPAPTAMAQNPAEHWDNLLRPALENDPDFPSEFFEQLRAVKLTFGDRVHCPFLRPFFLSPEDEQRVLTVMENAGIRAKSLV